MTITTFDTLKFVERLEQAGVPRAQASAMAEAQRDALSEALDTQIATKSDIQTIRSELQILRTDLRETEARLTGQITLIKWMVALITIVTVIPALKTLLG